MLNVLARKRGLFAGGEVRQVTIARHGATRLNNDDVSVDRIRGWKDVPLSPGGRAEAKQLAASMSVNPPDAIVASDLSRALETAETVSAVTGVPIVEVSPAFRPWNVGELAGALSSEAVPLLCRYAEYTPDIPIAGGESFNEFRGRFFNGLHDALSANQGRIAIVTHHRNDRLLHAWRALGYPRDGALDMKEFNRHGHHTGATVTVDVPMGALATAADAWPTGDPDRGKVDRASVDYSPGEGADYCGVCQYFMPGRPARCMKVAGLIDASMWCWLFKRVRDET